MAAITADRDLLFGLLALQNGLIDQVQLVAAFQAWTRDRTRPLAEHLLARRDLDPDDRAAVEALVSRHLKKHGGDVGKSLAAVHAGPPTRESLAALGDPEIERTLTQLATPPPDGDPDRTASYAVGTATSDGQRFRVLRPHARGGLGAVFVALDAELNREVALKQILTDHADDPVSRSRFLLEAEITGGLEHPGIVPVYGLGTYANGRPFYAMRFIRGDSLKEAADRVHADASIKGDPGRRSLELRKLLRRFTDACNAIDYAHSRGVLHRDIKPGNVIIGKHGETLVVDWGLAKATGRADPGADPGERTLIPSSASGSAETLPGSALGTPAYMSPEHADGAIEHLGPRSDVYSLGATLYYILTGRPPVTGDIAEVLRAVQRGEFPPPRRHDATIAPALEAVCLKAMAHRPGDRYSSPKALSEDIERWMADEPVSAYREPIATRAVRWVRRHRTGVVAASAAALVALIGLGVVAAIQTWANRELKRANGELLAANERERTARSQAEARFALARDAIEAYYTGVSRDVLLKESQLEDLRKMLLGSALAFYEKLQGILEAEPGQKARGELAAAYERVGEIHHEIGSRPAAREAFERAQALYERLARDDPAAAEYRAALAETRRRGGQVSSEAGLASEARPALESARALYERLAREHPDDPQYRRGLAVTHTHLGTLLGFWMGRPDEGFREYQRAVALYERLARDQPDAAELASDLAEVQRNIGRLLSDAGRDPDGLKVLERVVSIQQRLAREHPDVLAFQATLARAEISIGVSRGYVGNLEGAMESFRQALALYERLTRAHPTVTDYQNGLGHAQHSIGWALAKMGRHAEAIPELRKALPVIERLAREHPTVTSYQERLARSHSILGDTFLSMSNLSEALPELRRAREIHEQLAREHPTVGPYRSAQALDHIYLAAALYRMARYPESRREYQRALEVYEGLSNPLLIDLYNAACAHARLAAMSLPNGRAPTREEESDASSHADRAMAGLLRAFALGYRDLYSLRSDPDLEPLRSRPEFRMLLLDAAFPAEAFAPRE